MRRHLLLLVPGLALLLAVLACSTQQASGPGGSGSATADVAAMGSRPPSRPVKKLLVVMMENHSLRQMKADMPYTVSLAKRYGYATDYHALTHPSLPNYLAIVGGQMYGVEDDDPPADHPLDGRTVFGQAIARGKTAAVFAEDMPGRCALDATDTYAVKHNPWAYFVPERDLCQRFDKPYGALPRAIRHGRLPNAGMVVPNRCNDAHDCDLGVADEWFKRLMHKVFAGPDWRKGRLAVVLTADEDDYHQDDLVLTVVIHPSQRHRVVTRRLDHYSLTRLYDEVLHAPRLGQAKTAPSMARAFHLPLR